MKVAETIVKLKKETKALRKEVYIMKALLKQQNEIIRNMLEKTYAVKRPIVAVGKRKYFPLTTQESLDNFESLVDETNRDEVINEARLNIRLYGLVKSLKSFISPTLIGDYNLEGTYNKKRLLNYQNFLDVLYKAVEEEKGVSHEEFIKELRVALHNIKKRNAISRWTLSKLKSEVKKQEADSDEIGESEDEEDDGE